MVSISCKDFGTACDFVARAANVDALIPLVEDHAKKIHGFQSLPPELVTQIRDKVRSESGSRKI
jgi:predicted small metal-binding protein